MLISFFKSIIRFVFNNFIIIFSTILLCVSFYFFVGVKEQQHETMLQKSKKAKDMQSSFKQGEKNDKLIVK